MKFGKKLFIVLGLVAILASLFVTTAFAGGPTGDMGAGSPVKVDKYDIIIAPPLTILQLQGKALCGSVVQQPSSLVSGKKIYITVQFLKFGGLCAYPTSERWGKQVSFTNLTPGATYTVYINPGNSAGGIKSFKFVAPQPGTHNSAMP